MKKISLFGRKRLGDLVETETISEIKKDELLALKLDQINTEARSAGNLQMLPIDLIKPDLNQPRKQFRHIDSLAKSIEEKGIIQPIIVSIKNKDGFYTIIAGERRYRAALEAGLLTLPCIIRQESDANILILQLLENDQRENVSPLEESEALCQLINQMNLSKAQIAKELGRDPSWVSIRLGLKKASEGIKALIQDGIIEDIRTLHELRMFEESDPIKAQTLITRMRNNTVTGSYRQVIANARRAKNSSLRAARTYKIQNIKLDQQESTTYLELDLGGERPVRYEIDQDLLENFVSNLISNLDLAEVTV